MNQARVLLSDHSHVIWSGMLGLFHSFLSFHFLSKLSATLKICDPPVSQTGKTYFRWKKIQAIAAFSLHFACSRLLFRTPPSFPIPFDLRRKKHWIVDWSLSWELQQPIFRQWGSDATRNLVRCAQPSTVVSTLSFCSFSPRPFDNIPNRPFRRWIHCGCSFI